MFNNTQNTCPACEYNSGKTGTPVERDGEIVCLDCGNSWKVFGNRRIDHFSGVPNSPFDTKGKTNRPGEEAKTDLHNSPSQSSAAPSQTSISVPNGFSLSTSDLSSDREHHTPDDLREKLKNRLKNSLSDQLDDDLAPAPLKGKRHRSSNRIASPLLIAGLAFLAIGFGALHFGLKMLPAHLASASHAQSKDQGIITQSVSFEEINRPGGKKVVRVKGRILNTRSEKSLVKKVEIILRGKGGLEINRWHHTPKLISLEPGAAIRFSSAVPVKGAAVKYVEARPL